MMKAGELLNDQIRKGSKKNIEKKWEMVEGWKRNRYSSELLFWVVREKYVG